MADDRIGASCRGARRIGLRAFNFPGQLRGIAMSRHLNQGGRQPGELQRIGIDPFESDFNMNLAQPLSRSVRLNGFATCLRLEAIYWMVLERIARANRCTVNAVLSHVDREVHLRHGGVRNFSGLVRVICVVFLLEEGVRPSPRAH